jgi:hypothetical protein
VTAKQNLSKRDVINIADLQTSFEEAVDGKK